MYDPYHGIAPGLNQEAMPAIPLLVGTSLRSYGDNII